MENITLPPDDARRASLLSRMNKLEGELDVIALSSRQMHIICPLEILRALLRHGHVNFFELKADMIAKYNYTRKSFSEEHFLSAFMKLAGEIGVPQKTEQPQETAVA